MVAASAAVSSVVAAAEVVVSELITWLFVSIVLLLSLTILLALAAVVVDVLALLVALTALAEELAADAVAVVAVSAFDELVDSALVVTVSEVCDAVVVVVASVELVLVLLDNATCGWLIALASVDSLVVVAELTCSVVSAWLVRVFKLIVTTAIPEKIQKRPFLYIL